MLTHPTLDQLRALKLDGMARALEEQRIQPVCQDLPFEDRLGMLVDRERHWRDGRRLDRLLRAARLKHGEACLEDVLHNPGRGLDKRLIATLSGGDWIRQKQSLLITGPTGVGKTWLACALAQHACRQGFPALYQRVPRLTEALRIAHADGIRRYVEAVSDRNAASARPVAAAEMAEWTKWALAQADGIDPVLLESFLLPVCDPASEKSGPSKMRQQSDATPSPPTEPEPWHPNQWYTRLHR